MAYSSTLGPPWAFFTPKILYLHDANILHESKSLKITRLCGLAGQMCVAGCQKVGFTPRLIRHVAPNWTFKAQVLWIGQGMSYIWVLVFKRRNWGQHAWGTF
eukprot:882495-Pelagomonas_calceolata.AAC.1